MANKSTQTLAERFWVKVDKLGPVVQDEIGNCWTWTASQSSKGYGHIGRGGRGGGMGYAHRVAWELEVGPIPDGLLVLHRCDNRLCVRVAHLFLGTAFDNTADMLAKGRGKNSKRTRCIRGHLYDGVRADGKGRTCSTCLRRAKAIARLVPPLRSQE